MQSNTPAGGFKEPTRSYGTWWGIDEEMVAVPVSGIRQVVMAGLQKGGASAEDAAYLLEISLNKALQGDHARGLRGTPALVRRALAKELDWHPQISILRERGATALVGAADPKNANNTLVCRFAMDLAIKKARQYGVGWVGARAQAGILRAFVLQAVAQDMIGVCMTQSHPQVAPFGGAKPLFGNGATAIGIPAADHDPVVLDMSLTESSTQGVVLAQLQGKPLREGILLDDGGNPSTNSADYMDPEWLKKGREVSRGSSQPLGGGHKGYALVFVQGLLSYILSDTNPPWECSNALEPSERGLHGSIHVAIDPSAFAPLDQVKRQVSGFIEKARAVPLRPGSTEVLYPGEGSQRLHREGKARDRVTIPSSQYHDLAALAKELGMEGAI